MPSAITLRNLVASAAACLISSCATGPRYQATTGNTGTIHGNMVNPVTVMAGTELHTSIVSIDGVASAGGRSYVVDAGKHSIQVRGTGSGGFSVFGTLRLTVEKDQHYYVRCRRGGAYHFTCEIEEDDGRMKVVAEAPSGSQP